MNDIYVAKLGRAVGLKGEQKIHIESDFPEQFKENSKFITDKKQELIVESFNSKNNTIKFVGINNIDLAKKLTNRLLFVTIEDTKKQCQLKEKEFFWFDLMDTQIIENEEILGKVVDIQRLPSCDYLVVNTTDELKKQKLSNQFLLPYLDNYIVKVDIENKIIIVKNSKDILEAS